MAKNFQKNICYRLKSINSARFMARSLSNLANNSDESIYKIKYKSLCDSKK